MADWIELKRLLEACKESNCADADDFGRRIADLYDYLDPETVAVMVSEVEALRSALSNLLSLYEEDEGCRSLPQYIAGVAAMSKESGYD